ncbi:hypothetical protein AAF712_016331, partial [Marasmius tenuissimus]
MILDIRVLRERAAEATQSGRPEVVRRVMDGGRGRPRVEINPVFLSWAYSHRTQSAIAQFLGISRSTVHRALLDQGVVQPGEDPFTDEEEDSEPPHPSSTDDFLSMPENDPNPNPNSDHMPPNRGTSTGIHLGLSGLSDDELDDILLGLRGHYPRAGIKTLQGMMRSM